MEFDIIGDIHGHVEPLRKIIGELGFWRTASGWFTPQPGRMIIFLGDLVDRGPDQRGCVALVRELVDSGHAMCLMGNHEHAAIGWATQNPQSPHDFLHPHTEKNLRNHRTFLAQFGEGSHLHQETVKWMKGLPIYLDLRGIRCVHACWDPMAIAAVKPMLDADAIFTDEGLVASYGKGSPQKRDIDILLRGPEFDLPSGIGFTDQEGTYRTKSRLKWWSGKRETKLREATVEDIDTDAECVVEMPLDLDDRPTFFGHYWMKGQPQLLSEKRACLDFSVAARGYLTAYRWRGETRLDPENLIWV